METLTASSYERFWRLCQAATRASEPEQLDKIGGDGYAYVLRLTVHRAVNYDMDTVVRLTREGRERVPSENPVDFWRDGYMAGCDKAISIMQGGF